MAIVKMVANDREKQRSMCFNQKLKTSGMVRIYRTTVLILYYLNETH